MDNNKDCYLSDTLPKDWERGKLLGWGHFGKVYLLIDTAKPDDELYVVKDILLSQVIPSKENTLREFRRETEILLILKKHVRIVPFFGTAITDTVASLFFGYMKLGSLREYYADKGHLDEVQCIAYAKQILEGLCYLHERRIIHRDIKGANILLENEEHLRLTDFGISKIVEQTTVGITLEVGTARWMAPEVCNPPTQNKDYDFKADIWSVGCTIVEMITGGVPYGNIEREHAVMLKVGSGEPPTWPNTISQELSDILDEMFTANPKKRKSAEQLLIKLNTIMELTHVDTKDWLMRTKLNLRAVKRKVLGTKQKICQISAPYRIKTAVHVNGHIFIYRVLSLVISTLASDWTSHPHLAFSILQVSMLFVLNKVKNGIPKGYTVAESSASYALQIKNHPFLFCELASLISFFVSKLTRHPYIVFISLITIILKVFYNIKYGSLHYGYDEVVTKGQTCGGSHAYLEPHSGSVTRVARPHFIENILRLTRVATLKVQDIAFKGYLRGNLAVQLLSDVYIHNEYFEQLELREDFFSTAHRNGFVCQENFSQQYVDLFTGRRDNRNLFEFIQSVADLTVSININVYQEERYKYVYCKPSFGLLGLEKSIDIFGSGIVYRIDRSCQNINVQLRRFPAMKNVCADIYIATAAHLVPDQLAYSIADCVFFFDGSSDGASPNYVHNVVEIVEYNAKDNWCLLRLRTCNIQLIERLENVMEKFDALRVKIYNEYKGSRDDERLMFSVSHPYGSDKHISLGRWESLEIKNDIWSTFTYQAPMFPGSAGAYVHMLGYSGRVWHYPHLHRCNKQSGAGYHVQ
ncbi:uncharacterized protein LOC106077574 isoform X2 [Biomphalaria glabrata]|uniref:Uncharacterized protein LOC106077574 isoform X2 n=1 Tax=Biomphalaria glabrata TaxID=6526 RepID=A0A9W2ZES1_BIOGL|nr:uncharacterized protein LOC106077574 isoform X2 [Biomphalaria glabrata]